MPQTPYGDFETDFWKDATARHTWDEIIPGEPRATKPFELTKDIIATFAEMMGETNPLYFDEEYAKSTPYGGIVAPPSIHILLMFACTGTDDWMRSPGTINASQSWHYHIPARPGDVISMQGRALDRYIRKGRMFVIHDNIFTNQRDQVICTGRGWTIRPN